MLYRNVIAFFLIFSGVFFTIQGQATELTEKPIIAKFFDENADVQVRFDTVRIFPPPDLNGTTVFRDVGAGIKFKGFTDDTVRVFTVMSSAPFYAMLVNDTTTNPPLKVATAGWQRHGNNGRYIDSVPKGAWGAAVGDVNGDEITDMIYGQADTFLGSARLYRAWWNGSNWQRESLASFRGAIKDIAIGDADNNGSSNDIIVAAGTGVFRVRRSGSVWQRDSLWAGSASCNGVAIGDFNHFYVGNEIIAVTQESRIIQMRWTGSAWSVWNIISQTNLISLDDVTIGDFDPDSAGNEVVILNSHNFTQYGNIFICYLQRNVWRYRALGAFFSSEGMGKAGEVLVGNVFELADNNQIVFTAGDASSSYNYPIILYRADTTYWIRALPRTGGSTYGIAINDINKHRISQTQEMAITGNGRIYEYDQRLFYNYDVSASRVNFTPLLVAAGDSVTITVRIKNFGYYAQDTIPVFYRILGSGVNIAESCFVNLSFNDSTDYSFRTKYYALSAGNYTIRCSLGLANEQYPWDDTASSVLSVRNALVGEKLVGIGGDFTTLTSALNFWNNSIVKGRVTFRLINEVYTAENYPLVFSPPFSYRDSTWSLTVKPSGSNMSQFSSTNSSAIFDLNRINNLFVDNVSLINNGTGAVVRFSNGAGNNVISNSLLRGSSNLNTTGVVAFMGTTTGTGNDNNVIDNCIITKNTTFSPVYGVFINGGSVANQNNVIRKCQIYNFSNSGVYLKANATNTTITDCDIYTQDVQVSLALNGIAIEDWTVGGTMITSNKIRDLRTAQANAVICGIYLYYGSTTNPTVIANNFIYLDATNQNEQATLYGIFEDTYPNVRIDIYHNSIYIGGSSLSADKNSYGLFRNFPCAMNFKNNIIFNNRSQASGIGKHYAVYCANITGTFNSDYNDLFVATSGSSSGQLIGFWGAPCTTLQQWRSRSGRDANSISKNPNFVSATDLHINSYSPNVDRKATPIGTVSKDIDNQNRSASYPDIGADEYAVEPPSTFNLVSPNNNATLVWINGYLVWQPSVSAEYYDVLLDTVNPPTRKVSALQTDTTFYFHELYPFKDYYWQIKAFNDTNPSEAVTVSAIWKFKTVPLPAEPTNLVIGNVYAEQMSLSWADNSGDELGFYIKRDTIPNGVFLTVDSVGANTSSYLAQNLIPNTRYWWRVCAYNQYGFRGFTGKDSSTLAKIPGLPQLDSVSFQTAKIIINPLNNSAPTQFCVRVNYNAMNKYLHPNGVLVDTIVWATYAQFGAGAGKMITGLFPNTAYSFQVRARNRNNINTNFGPGVTQATSEPFAIYYTESFENQDFPPYGWTQQVLVPGGTNWTKITNGTNPTTAPYHGQFQARYNSYNASSGARSRLITPPIDLRTIGRVNLKFYMYHDNETTNPDSLVIESSIDNGLTWRRLSRFNRYASSSAWQQHLVSLHNDSGHISFIAFHAYSGNGRNMYIDSISFVPYQDVMVSQITRPNLTELKRVGFTPQVIVINNSAQSQNIPVAAEIYKPSVGFSQEFDQPVFPPNGWLVYNNDGGAQIWQRNSASPYSGAGCATSTSEGGSVRNDDWLVMPQISIGNNDTFRFFYKTSAAGNDSLEVWLSTTTNAISSFSNRLAAFGVRNTGYLEKTVSLSSYAGQQVCLALVNRSLNANTIFVDAIRINYTAPTLLYAKRDTLENLASTASASVTFDLWTPICEGTYRFVTYTDLATDMNSYNNYLERLFTVNPIPLNLISPYPEQFTNNTTPAFDWQDVFGATQYQIQVDDDPNFTSPHTNALVSVSNYSILPGNGLTDGNYYWRVRVTEPTPQDPYSNPRRFIVDTQSPSAPNLSLPVCGLVTNNRQPTFIWRRVAGVDSFNLIINSTKNPVVNIKTSDTAHTITQMLNEGDYWWSVRAKDSAGNWSEASVARALFIDLTPPNIPTLVAPAHNQVMQGTVQILVWNSVADAFEYQVNTGSQNLYTTDTSYTHNFNQGSHEWKVRARDLAGNWSGYSETRTFRVIIGWIQIAPLPSKQAAAGKYVKDGGAIVGANNALYAFRGNKSNEFYKYIIEDDTWATNIETIPFGKKIDEPYQIITKKVGKGAALCFDGNDKIYATKGNGTYELWMYSITDRRWTFQSFVPTNDGVKGGTSIVCHNNRLYLLVGGQKKYQKNFFSYNPVTRNWAYHLAPAPLTPDDKTFRDGSCITVLNGVIYALKGSGKNNSFYSYDTLTNTWTYREHESIPRVHPSINRKVMVKDGGAMIAGNNRIYAIKGNKRNEFWSYSNGSWSALETIPKGGNPKAMVKTGGALAYLNGKIYLLKGNNTNQVWQYIPGESENSEINIKNSNISTVTQAENRQLIMDNPQFKIDVVPNPFSKSAVINYSVSKSGPIRIKLFDASGRLIDKLLDEYKNAGSYQTEIGEKNFKIPKGIYFLKYEANDNKTEVKLMVR